MSDDDKKKEEHEVLVDLTHDTFMRNVSIHIHADRPMKAQDFMEQLADIVATYQECPEELFELVTEFDDGH